jgi:tripartite-type tricarboxylate transporter receptor subunit TctC
MSSPETRAKFNAMGAEPQSGDSKELGTLLHSETVVWSKVIKESHISFQ